MATILRDWSYRYQWLYDTIASLAALSVGGETRFRNLPIKNLDIHPNFQILDLCCGSGQTTKVLVKLSNHVTGLDASPMSLQRAKKNVPEAEYVEAFAEKMPFLDNSFDLVHSSAAMHEMAPQQLQQICQEVYRILKPGGIFTLVDFHRPNNWLFWPGVAMFLWLFETETAWQLLETNLTDLLSNIGFQLVNTNLYAGGSLQVVQVRKPF